ncbi:hypothetical protein PTSG_03203 [Salpingoeca rosetta]|uniref:Uncharacterized protein n=1 Tax=Salpingoeca rosetta (strain ATCC 50818 / BSB-021) TaxID=946362 RepID=F2U4I5_SALR5|nr:uncharacterized protein PTSG_03203 [Salpingoeca rosetta]EGD82551.1 hypothetical protein PTSG_03203 [Salpingoeca rosetta]|eukprot:XP_004995787.1 hypothetical protein PTSG_03203 [Salpingoeca rosetta]
MTSRSDVELGAHTDSSLLPGPRKTQETQAKRGGLIVRRPQSTPERLIFPFFKTRWCSTRNALADNMLQVPEELARHGVTQDDWQLWMDKLETNVQPKSTSMCSCIFGIAFLLPIPILVVRQRRYQRAVKQWLDGFNKEVFQPLGLYATTQTGVVQINRSREEISWLAVATTHDEADNLMQEPHMWYYNMVTGRLDDISDSCCSCCVPKSFCGTETTPDTT